MLVGQDLFVMHFEPPAPLEHLLLDPECPRSGPAVLLFADSIAIDQWRAEPREPQKALWTEVAIGYECQSGGKPATAFHYPWLMLSRAFGDIRIPVADIEMTRFHNACPDYDGPAAGRRAEADARTLDGELIANLEIVLTEPAADGLPPGLMRWVNRIRYPDVTRPGHDVDLGSNLVWAEDLQVSDLWRGDARVRFGSGMGWSGELHGKGLKFGVLYRLCSDAGVSP